MFANQLIFNNVYGKGTLYTGSTLDGDVYQKYASVHIGYIAGDKREIKAIMTDDVQQLDNWFVFNIIDHHNMYIHSVAVLGVVASDRAEYLAQRYFGETAKPNTTAVFVGEFNYLTLKRYLDNVADDGGRIRLDDMQRIQAMATSQKVIWQDDVLISHSQSLPRLMLDLVANDDEHLLLDSMNKQDFTQFVQGLADGEILDALIVQNSKLPQMTSRLFTALQKLNRADFKIDNVTQSEPFKKDGAVNIALMLEFSDGQTLAIVFHNNDTTPAKLQASDVLTSWKFVLNKRDITAVLQPESGQNVVMSAFASRIMQVVEKNSAKFKKNNAKKEQDKQKLADLQAVVAEKEQQLADLKAEQQALQQQKDELIHRGLPIIELSGNEFGEFDLNTDDGKKALREKVKQHLDSLRGQSVYCPALNVDVEIRKQGIKKFMSFTSNPVKLQIAHSILDIIKNGKVFKPSEVSYDNDEQKNKIVYHYLKTPFIIDGTEYNARVVIKEDSQGKFHYDLQVKDIQEMLDSLWQQKTTKRVASSSTDSFDGYNYDSQNNIQSQDKSHYDLQVNENGIDAILDSINKNTLESSSFHRVLACLGYENYDNQSNSQSQSIFDSINQDGYVLNLFIFDKDGNEIDDLTQDVELLDYAQKLSKIKLPKDVFYHVDRLSDDLLTARITVGQYDNHLIGSQIMIDKHKNKDGFISSYQDIAYHVYDLQSAVDVHITKLLKDYLDDEPIVYSWQ